MIQRADHEIFEFLASPNIISTETKMWRLINADRNDAGHALLELRIKYISDLN